jgi:hypothetical protein
MGIYGLIILCLGVLLIGLLFTRFDITRPKTIILLLITLVSFLALFFSIHHHLQKTCLILEGDSLDDIRNLIQSWGVAAPLMSIMLMILQAVIAPLPAFLITATNGLVFGVYWGTVISWIGAMCGALVSFTMSRLFYKSFSGKIRSHRKGIEYIDRLSSKYGFRVILAARLLPFISIFNCNRHRHAPGNDCIYSLRIRNGKAERVLGQALYFLNTGSAGPHTDLDNTGYL